MDKSKRKVNGINDIQRSSNQRSKLYKELINIKDLERNLLNEISNDSLYDKSFDTPKNKK